MNFLKYCLLFLCLAIAARGEEFNFYFYPYSYEKKICELPAKFLGTAGLSEEMAVRMGEQDYYIILKAESSEGKNKYRIEISYDGGKTHALIDNAFGKVFVHGKGCIEFSPRQSKVVYE